MNVDLNTNQSLRVVIIDGVPAIIVTQLDQNFRFRNQADMDLNLARQVFYRMKHAGQINLDYFDLLHTDFEDVFYLVNQSLRTSKAHIWNSKHADSYCHLWSSGHIKSFDIIHKAPEGSGMCTMCAASYNKKMKKLEQAV